jgi:hypothetical protein
MNPTIVLTILIWTLIVAGFGFVFGHAFRDESNRRRSASQELRHQISRLSWDAFMLDHQLKTCWTSGLPDLCTSEIVSVARREH